MVPIYPSPWSDARPGPETNLHIESVRYGSCLWLVCGAGICWLTSVNGRREEAEASGRGLGARILAGVSKVMEL